MATNTLILKFARLATVKAVTSPAPRSSPSVVIFRPIKIKKKEMKSVYEIPVSNAALLASASRNAETKECPNNWMEPQSRTAKQPSII